MADVIQSRLIGAGEKTFRSLTSCGFYLLLSPILRQRGRLLLTFFYTRVLLLTCFYTWVLLLPSVHIGSSFLSGLLEPLLFIWFSLIRGRVFTYGRQPSNALYSIYGYYLCGFRYPDAAVAQPSRALPSGQSLYLRPTALRRIVFDLSILSMLSMRYLISLPCSRPAVKGLALTNCLPSIGGQG